MIVESLGCEIFIYLEEKGSGWYGLNDPDHGIHESRCHMNHGAFFDKGELFPLQKAKFGPLEVMIPSNPVGNLQRAYGSKKDPDRWNNSTKLLYRKSSYKRDRNNGSRKF